MSSTLLEQFVRMQTAVTEYVADLRERMREEAGQTTVEWLVIMVGLIALAGVLAGTDMWQGVAKSMTKAFSDLLDKIIGKVK